MSDNQKENENKVGEIETFAKEDNITKEAEQVLKAADQLLKVLEKLAPQTNSGKIANAEAFVKIVRPLCVNIENTLPELLDFADNLDYIEDKNADVLREKIRKIEDDYLPELLNYLNQYDKEHPREKKQLHKELTTLL